MSSALNVLGVVFWGLLLSLAAATEPQIAGMKDRASIDGYTKLGSSWDSAPQAGLRRLSQIEKSTHTIQQGVTTNNE